MKSILTVTLLLLLHGICQSQPLRDSTAYKETILKQATVMGNAFIQKDYETFAKFTHPEIFRLSGGKQKMIGQLQKLVKDMEEQGNGFLSVEMGAPGDIVQTNTELQCVLLQILTLKVPNGKLKQKSTLIAVSNDKGRHWVFIDSGGKDLRQLRQVVPTLSSNLNLSAREKPIFYAD